MKRLTLIALLLSCGDDETLVTVNQDAIGQPHPETGWYCYLTTADEPICCCTGPGDTNEEIRAWTNDECDRLRAWTTSNSQSQK